MKRYEIIDAIEEIQDNNSKRFVGMNESELWTREDIADFILKQLAEKDAEIERLRESISESKIDLLKSIESQLSELQKQSCNPNSLTKRGGEYRIGLSKAKDFINDNIYLIQNNCITSQEFEKAINDIHLEKTTKPKDFKF